MKNWKTLLLGIAMIANTSFAAPQVVDKVAAVVNNGVVLESDVYLKDFYSGPIFKIGVSCRMTRFACPTGRCWRNVILHA